MHFLRKPYYSYRSLLLNTSVLNDTSVLDDKVINISKLPNAKFTVCLIPRVNNIERVSNCAIHQ